MSYVLDALRKSEHERQMASGQSASILYPVIVEQNRMAWLWSAMLVGVILAVVVIVFIWWMWPHTSAVNATSAVEKSVVTVAPTSPVVQTRELVAQAAKPATGKQVALAATPAKRLSEPALKKSAPAKKSIQPAPPAVVAVEKTEPDNDPLKGMPPLVISGYMHDEQVGSVALINDKLVHEGEEIAPGLRLEKILGDGALFNYKGHQFRR